MSRTSLMTVGLLAVFIGIQLNLVDSFVLTPRATEFWQKRFTGSLFETTPLDEAVAKTRNDYYSGQNSFASGNSYLNGNDTRGHRFGQYSRSYARNNYPFDGPSYSNQQFSMPNAFNGRTPAYTAGYKANRNQLDPFGYFGPQKVVTPPKWICWASIFLGAVMFIYGAAMGRD